MELDDDDIKVLGKIPDDVISGGIKELQENIFRSRRWVKSATVTIEALQKKRAELDEGDPDRELIENALGDLLEAGLLLIKNAERDMHMSEVAEEAQKVVGAKRMVKSIEEFINRIGE